MAHDFGFEASTTPGYYFISYNSEDVGRISNICNHLYNAGLRIWYDGGIPHDSNWEGVLAEKIDNCDEAIFFITKGIFTKAKNRELSQVYPYKEYDLAKNIFQKKTLIVLLDEIDAKNDIPYSLMGWWQEISPSVKQGVVAYNTDTKEAANKILHELGFKKCFTIEDDIKYPVFNSVIDHPDLRDEREFIHIRQIGESEWHRSMKLSSGNQYEIKVNFRNDAAPKYNEPLYKNQGVAFQVKASVDIPRFISKQSMLKVRISWEKNQFCEDNILLDFSDGKSKKIDVVLGQTKIHNNWKANGAVLPYSLFSFDGTYIGLNSLNGIILAGDEYSGYINFFIDVE